MLCDLRIQQLLSKAFELKSNFFFYLLNEVFQTLKVGNVLKISSFCDVLNSLLQSVYAFPISHYS